MIARTIQVGLLALATAAAGADDEPRPRDPVPSRERTSFQTHAPWDPTLQFGSDVAICYGIDGSLPERIAGWKRHGYIPHLMTGVAWGEYQDYLFGRFDGQNHEDEAQTDRNGQKIAHGRDVYYMSPGINYGKFLAAGVQRAIAAGAEAIHLEEPEFWVRAGYSAGFQREWRDFYHEAWVPPHSSPDARYRASLLKYHLYQRALKQVFDVVKDESSRRAKPIPCYVPTHSLLNYAQWEIVSPESSLLRVGADGFIAQVWTGTARTPNVYEGRKRERTFETAFLEYGAMSDVVRPSGGTVWFLNDPIEDNPDHSWFDYRTNWESTLTASLLWPEVSKYEVMPWPERIVRGQYPTVDRAHRKPGEPVAREPIPAAYATELLTVINALNDMNQPDIRWDCGTRGLGVLVSDSMMFQRGDPHPSDPDLGSFYGLALPLLKRGMPVAPVQLENVGLPGALAAHKVLWLTYEGMKPMTPDVHTALAGWVRQGGVLVFVGDDSDPYNAVRSWWNDAARGMSYPAPRWHLFEQLGLPATTPTGEHAVGQGRLIYDTASPAALTRQATGGDHLRDLARRACAAARLDYRETNRLILRRGPYVVAAGLDESTPDSPTTLRGHFLDLFDPRLPIVTEVALTPGSRRLLYDLDRPGPAPGPRVLAAAAKVLDSQVDRGRFSFRVEGPAGTRGVARVLLPAGFQSIMIEIKPGEPPDESGSVGRWDQATRTVWVRFPNAPDGRRITLE